MSDLLRDAVNEQLRSDVPEFAPGDTIKVSYRIREGDKERIQAFEGVCITRRGGGTAETFTVQGLTPSTAYTFALKTADEVSNWSTLSNRPDAVTGPLPELPEMVLVPAGSFTMGDGSAVCGVDERAVTLTRAFELSRYEVTNQQYLEAVQWAYLHGHVIVTAAGVFDVLDGGSEELLDLDDPEEIGRAS